MRVSKLGLFVLLCLTLSACFRQPAPSDASISTNAGLIASTLPTNGATNVRGQKVTINFSEGMDKTSVERGFTLYTGKYDPATNPSTFAKLQLTAMCNGRWCARNPNAFPFSFNWDVYNGNEKGIGVVPANADAFFYSSTGSKTVRLFVGTQQQQVKASNTTVCSSPAYTFEWSTDNKKVTVTSTTPLAPNADHTTTLSTLTKSQAGTKLTAPFSFGFKTYDPNGPTRTEGALTPGSSFTGVDGITVKASQYLDKTLQLYVERLTDTSSLIPLSWAKDSPLKAETAYYKIGATQNYRLRPGAAFLVRVPLPDGVSPQGLAIFELASSEGTLKPLPRPDGPLPSENPYMYWSSAPVTYHPDTNEISFPSSAFTTKGATFAIVSGAYKSSRVATANLGEITAQAHTTPTFEAVCRDDLFLKATKRETCNQKAIDQAVTALQNAYTAFHDTYGFPPPSLAGGLESNSYTIELRPASYVDVCVTGADGYCQYENGEKIVRQDLGGQYDASDSENRIIWAAVYPNPDGGFTDLELEAVTHEFFHTMQWGFDSINNFSYKQDSTWDYPKGAASWFIESTTALAQGSLDTLTVSGYYGGLRDLTISLYSPDGYAPYQTGQFFKFLADQAGATTFDFFLPFFTQRQVNSKNVAAWDVNSVSAAIAETTDFDGLADAYYAYVDNRIEASTAGCTDPSDLGAITEVPIVPNPNGNGESVFQFDYDLDPLSIRVIRLPGNRDATKPDYSGITDTYPNIQVIPFNQNGVGCVVFVNTDTTPLASGGTSTSVNIVIPMEPWQVNYGEIEAGISVIRGQEDSLWFLVENFSDQPLTLTASENPDASWMSFGTSTLMLGGVGYDFIALNMACPDSLSTYTGMVTFDDSDGKTQDIQVTLECIDPPPCTGRYCTSSAYASIYTTGIQDGGGWRSFLPENEEPPVVATVFHYRNCEGILINGFPYFVGTHKPRIAFDISYHPPTAQANQQPGPITGVGIEQDSIRVTLSGSGYNQYWAYLATSQELDVGSHTITFQGISRTFKIDEETVTCESDEDQVQAKTNKVELKSRGKSDFRFPSNYIS